jgi:hypothetical protein
MAEPAAALRPMNSPDYPWYDSVWLSAYERAKATIAREISGAFTAHSLVPGQAVVFSGSSQWHYRDSMPGTRAGKFCDLVFFHFVPRGTLKLSDPANWAQWFGVPELAQQARPTVGA